MSELTNVRPIKAISFGGPIQGGHGIAFTITFEDGVKENYYCRADQLPMMIGSLVSFGSLAEQMRGFVKKGEVNLATPYIVTEVHNSGRTHDGRTIAIVYGTSQNFPLQIAMTPEQARKTIQFLERELAGIAQAQEPDRRN